VLRVADRLTGIAWLWKSAIITVVECRGDFSELPLAAGWGMGDSVGLLFGTNDNGSFEISRRQLAPEGSAKRPHTSGG
jgi:hypothetical protein